MASVSSHEPATGALLWQGEASDVDAEVASIAAAWPQWAARAFTYRIETLRRFANLVRAREGEITDLIARETGRPLWDARTETAALVETVEHCISAYSQRTGQKRLEGALGARQALRHKPHGVLAAICPQASPALIPAEHIIPALIAGNGVAFKPSEKVPATGMLLVSLLHEAGVPQDIVRCVIGGPETGQALVAHDRIAGVLFTGTAQTGMVIHRALADRPDKLAVLAMGGNNPIVLWDTPDIASAVALVIQSAFLSSGQRCTAARRLIIKESLADVVIEELRRMTGRLIIDQPHADPVPYMGPIIDMKAADRLTDDFLYLMSNGGRPITHMRRPVDDAPFVTPGIIDVTAMEKRPDAELFGPILQVVRVADFDAAIVEANNSRFGLCAALLGGSPELYDRFWANARAGIVNWNRATTSPLPGAPMGGTGLSGNYRPGGFYAADHCAYPVASAEIEQPRATIGIGLKAYEIIADR
jgi:succinylglutamic semialdehyde dehydrogenase